MVLESFFRQILRTKNLKRNLKQTSLIAAHTIFTKSWAGFGSERAFVFAICPPHSKIKHL